MASPGGWTYRVALNCLRRRTRRAAMERRLLRRGVRERSLAPPAGEAWEVVRSLPPRQRAVVVLRYVADLSQSEIAEVLGVTRSTVSSTLDRKKHTSELQSLMRTSYAVLCLKKKKYKT